MKCLRSYARAITFQKNAHSGGNSPVHEFSFFLPILRILLFFFLGYRFRHGVPNVTGILFGYELSISVENDCRKHEILILEACPPFNLGSFFKMKEKKKIDSQIFRLIRLIKSI